MSEPAYVIQVQMTPEQLEEAIERAVRKAVVEKPPESDWLKADVVAAMLGVKKGTIRSLVHRDGLPCHRAGKAYVFKREELEAWLETRAHKLKAQSAKHGANLRAIRGGKKHGGG